MRIWRRYQRRNETPTWGALPLIHYAFIIARGRLHDLQALLNVERRLRMYADSNTTYFLEAIPDPRSTSRAEAQVELSLLRRKGSTSLDPDITMAIEHHLEGRSYEDLAGGAQTSEAHVRVKAERGRNKLRAYAHHRPVANLRTAGQNSAPSKK